MNILNAIRSHTLKRTNWVVHESISIKVLRKTLTMLSVKECIELSGAVGRSANERNHIGKTFGDI